MAALAADDLEPILRTEADDGRLVPRSAELLADIRLIAAATSALPRTATPDQRADAARLRPERPGAPFRCAEVPGRRSLDPFAVGLTTIGPVSSW